jgi:mannose-1-phosphate guanylyltransferase
MLAQQHANLWPIILAGGRGERLSAFVKRMFGHGKPKQFCTFVGSRSMYEHTLDRADTISAADHKVTIVAEEHYLAGWPELSKERPGKVIVQPGNRDTAPAVFLALSYVRIHDPEAIVLICPSDHFVFPERQFCRAMLSAARLAEERRLVVLLGVQPDRPDTEYGWICPGADLGCTDGYRIRQVDAFLEKPNLETCKTAMSMGGLWNTSVIAAQASHLWSVGWNCFPGMMALFQEYEATIGSSEESTKLRAIYDRMPSHNFSTDVLQCIPDQLAVIELSAVVWADWGHSDRIIETLRWMGWRSPLAVGQAAAG